MAVTTLKLKGFEDLRKLRPELASGPAKKYFSRVGVKVQNLARKKAPVDQHILRNTITYEVDEAEFPSYVRIGSNSDHALPMEGGTGLLADLPGGTGRRHFPPPAALDLWAARHGFKNVDPVSGEEKPAGIIVARIIAKRGGLAPRRFLRDGLEEATPDIEGSILDKFAQEIEAEAVSGGT